VDSLQNLAKIGSGYYVDNQTEDIFIRNGDLMNGAIITIHGIVDTNAMLIQ